MPRGYSCTALPAAGSQLPGSPLLFDNVHRRNRCWRCRYPNGHSIGVRAELPVRVLDTRDGHGVVGGTVGKVAANGEIVVDFAAALGDLPADATALTFNLTYADGEGAGFATVWPDGESMPNVSNLNKVGAGPVANQATVKVGPTGRLRLHNTGGRSHYIMDFSGFYETIVSRRSKG